MRRRLLIATPFAPSATATEGGVRAAHGIVGELATRHDVALVYSAHGEIAPAVAAECITTHPVAVPALNGWRLRAHGPALAIRGRSVHGLSANVSAICERVRQVALDFRPEVVQVEYATLGDALGVVAGATRILTVYDPAVRLRENVGVRDARLPVVHELDAWCARREERRALQLADAVVVFTDDDRRLVAGDAPSATPVTTIPLGWDVPAVPLDPVGGEPPAIVFAGDYGHPPNVDAALRLACEVLPRVHAHHPDVRLELIGPDPPPKLIALAGERVEVPGRVPSIVERLDRAAMVVTPISIGGGVRVKVIEALAAGKALVASPRALAGLDIRDGEQVLVADGDEETAAAVTRILTDVGLRVRLARCAREWAEQTLSWSAMADRYDELYASLAGADRELEGVRG